MRKQPVSGVLAATIVLVASCFVRADDPPKQSDDVVALARRLEDAVRNQDKAAAESLLDTDALFDRLSAGVSAPPDFQAGFKHRFEAQSHSFMDVIVKAAGITSYHFLRARLVNGETHILFRIHHLTGGGGVNYHDWVAGKDHQGELKLQDVYVAVTGEMVSQTMHRVYVQAVLAAKPGLLDQLRGKDKEIAANLSKLVQIGQDSQKRQYQQVLDDYRALPKSMQEEKSCMVLRLVATEKLRKQSPQDYSAAMADYKRLFPGDPSVDLDCIDSLVETKQFAEARKSIDRIDTFTGGDPFLLILRGNTYKLEGGDDNLLLAKQSYQKAIAQEANLAQAYWALVTLSLETQNYGETAATLSEIQQKLHVKMKDLTTVPSYAGFVKSDAYMKWIAGQTPAPPETTGQ